MLKKIIIIYDSQESRSINKIAEWLANYQGVVECDNFNGYVEISNNIV